MKFRVGAIAVGLGYLAVLRATQAADQPVDPALLEFLGSVDMDPSVRKGGDTGMPVALAGRGSALGGAFYEVADKVVAAAEKVGNDDVLEIS